MTLTVSELERRFQEFRELANIDRADAMVVDAAAKRLAPLTAALGDNVPADLVETAVRLEQAAHDAKVRELEQRTTSSLRAAWAENERHIAAAEMCPTDPALESTSETVRAAAMNTRALQESSGWALLRGQTLAGVWRRYQATPDEVNPVLVGLVESQAALRFQDLALKADPDGDGAAVVGLQKAIKARQQARLAKHPELLAARAQLKALDDSAVTASLRQHVRSGRGIALRPRARAVRLPAVR